MSDDGSTKDDVKVPEGDVGDKIEKLFRTEEKDTSKWNARQFWENSCSHVLRRHRSHFHGRRGCYRGKGGSQGSLNPFAKRQIP